MTWKDAAGESALREHAAGNWRPHGGGLSQCCTMLIESDCAEAKAAVRLHVPPPHGDLAAMSALEQSPGSVNA